MITPEWRLRYHSFNAAWGVDEQLGSMRNGCGDHFFAHFGPAGCWVKGFAHECSMSPYRDDPSRPSPGVLDGVPAEFAGCLREPAFSIEEVTFCAWQRYVDTRWQIGPVQFPADRLDPDGSELLLGFLDGRPESYWAWAADYYEREVELTAVEHVYRHRPLTPELITRLNPEMSLDELTADIEAIGYPAAADA